VGRRTGNTKDFGHGAALLADLEVRVPSIDQIPIL
jgi:hypothetical protein